MAIDTYPWSVPLRHGDALSSAALSASERSVLERFLPALQEAVGDDLLAVWLYGSSARGERRRPESDVDVLVIAEGGHERYGRVAMDLSSEAAYAEGESPFSFSVRVYGPEWLRRRREIESFFIQEVDRDKILLAGGDL